MTDWLSEIEKAPRKGEPCSHPGCFSHISHPCEGCGRIGGRYMDWLSEIEKDLYKEYDAPIRAIRFRSIAEHDLVRMARVLRELVEILHFVVESTIQTTEEEIYNFRACEGEFSEDAEELCVAAREQS